MPSSPYFYTISLPWFQIYSSCSPLLPLSCLCFPLPILPLLPLLTPRCYDFWVNLMNHFMNHLMNTLLLALQNIFHEKNASPAGVHALEHLLTKRNLLYEPCKVCLLRRSHRQQVFMVGSTCPEVHPIR
jgi:hypothetical protein